MQDNSPVATASAVHASPEYQELLMAYGICLSIMTTAQLKTFEQRRARQQQLIREGKINVADCFTRALALTPPR